MTTVTLLKSIEIHYYAVAWYASITNAYMTQHSCCIADYYLMARQHKTVNQMWPNKASPSCYLWSYKLTILLWSTVLYRSSPQQKKKSGATCVNNNINCIPVVHIQVFFKSQTKRSHSTNILFLSFSARYRTGGYFLRLFQDYDRHDVKASSRIEYSLTLSSAEALFGVAREAGAWGREYEARGGQWEGSKRG